MAIYKGSKIISGASDVGILGSAHSVGDIFYTTRMDTALAGAVECNGGTYSTADYEGTGSIGELLAVGKLPYLSLEEYAQQISETGYCGCFAWDGGTTTAFRVPLLKDIFIEAAPMSEGQHAYRMRAGLPNITGSVGNSSQWRNPGVFENATGAFASLGSAGGRDSDGGFGSRSYGMRLDASRSSAIYGNSDTVQPEAVKYRAMVQLFNGTTDQAVATVGTVVAQVGELNSHRVVDFQIPTADNGYTWYRKYADRWVEQGGKTSTNGIQTLPVTMADTNYTVMRTNGNGQSATVANQLYTSVGTRTTTTIDLALDSSVSPVFWEVKGMAA